MKKGAADRPTPERGAGTDALAALPEYRINTRDIPERRDGSGARRGALFRPVKRQITPRLDADLIDGFRRRPEPDEGYRTSVNRASREYLARHDMSREDGGERRSRVRRLAAAPAKIVGADAETVPPLFRRRGGAALCGEIQALAGRADATMNPLAPVAASGPRASYRSLEFFDGLAAKGVMALPAIA